MTAEANKKLHYDVTFVGLRAQATAVGFLQLCKELRNAGVIDEPAIDRIKGAIVSELALGRPKSIPRARYMGDIQTRLDRLFKGEEPVGPAGPMSVDECDDASDGAA